MIIIIISTAIIIIIIIIMYVTSDRFKNETNGKQRNMLI